RSRGARPAAADARGQAMSEPENFLERWSRRKQQASVQPAQAPEAKGEKDEASAAVPAAPAETSEPKTAAFDIAELPSIESIGADTDVRGFLQPGVPPDLTRAALRRAWSSDPAIRDFVGLVENGWDFNDPNAMHGFGPISAADVGRLLAQAIGVSPSKTTEPAKIVGERDAAKPLTPPQAPPLPPAERVQEENSPARPSSGGDMGDGGPRAARDIASQQKDDDAL